MTFRGTDLQKKENDRVDRWEIMSGLDLDDLDRLNIQFIDKMDLMDFGTKSTH